MNFSGNRGYHIHARDKSYQDIGTDERKEIVDYIMGIGLDYTAFFERDEALPKVKISKGPKPDEPGYRGRFAKAVVSAGEKERKEIHRGFGKDENWKRFTDAVNSGNWNMHSFKSTDELIARLAPVASTLGLKSVNTDAGVTQDLSKLIRVPDTIHGDTGLVAKRVGNFDSINKFEPFRDALVRTSESIKIKFIEDVPQLPLGGQSIGPFKKDEEKELNKSIGLFYVLKGSAEIA
jgi:DNA primase small subunit